MIFGGVHVRYLELVVSKIIGLAYSYSPAEFGDIHARTTDFFRLRRTGERGHRNISNGK